MAKKAHPYRPKDINQLAKYIVDLSTGQIPDSDSKKKKTVEKPAKKEKNP